MSGSFLSIFLCGSNPVSWEILWKLHPTSKPFFITIKKLGFSHYFPTVYLQFSHSFPTSFPLFTCNSWGHRCPFSAALASSSGSTDRREASKDAFIGASPMSRDWILSGDQWGFSLTSMKWSGWWLSHPSNKGFIIWALNDVRLFKNNIWLVVYLPHLKKLSSSVRMMTFPIYGKS